MHKTCCGRRAGCVQQAGRGCAAVQAQLTNLDRGGARSSVVKLVEEACNLGGLHLACKRAGPRRRQGIRARSLATLQAAQRAMRVWKRTRRRGRSQHRAGTPPPLPRRAAGSMPVGGTTGVMRVLCRNPVHLLCPRAKCGGAGPQRTLVRNHHILVAAAHHQQGGIPRHAKGGADLGVGAQRLAKGHLAKVPAVRHQAAGTLAMARQRRRTRSGTAADPPGGRVWFPRAGSSRSQASRRVLLRLAGPAARAALPLRLPAVLLA